LEPFDVRVEISAFTDSGFIERVELRNNDVLEGTDYEYPYTFDLTGLLVGSYNLEARGQTPGKREPQADLLHGSVNIPFRLSICSSGIF